MTDWVANSCGGLRWRTHPDGTIELEGLGRIAVHPGTTRFTQLARTWDNWSSLFRSAAARTRLPVSWLVAIATIETGFLSSDPRAQAEARSPAGAFGVMQILAGRGGPYPNATTAELIKPTTNIQLASDLIKKLCGMSMSGGCQLPLIGAMYNAGSVRCAPERNALHLFEDHDYSRQIVEFNNAAIVYLNVNAGSVWPWVLGGMTVAAAGAAVWLR